MNDKYFINKGFDNALKSYIESKNKKDGLVYNSFLVVTIRALSLIYSELDILNPYYLQNSIALINNLGKYSYSKTDIATFLEDILNFYKIEEENNNKIVKEKNPYFISIQKYLVDMFIAKKNNTTVTYIEEDEFLELLYTSHTKNPYRISYNYLMSNDTNFIEKYYYSKANAQEVTRVDLDKTISSSINLDALNFMGINLSNLSTMKEKEIYEAQNKLYNYFEIDENSLNKDEELKKAMDFYKLYGRKITSGNGYVDILLLLSVIVTSLSVIAIILFNIM